MHYLFICVILCLTCWSMSSAEVCSTTEKIRQSFKQQYTTGCGWWGWSRCTRYKIGYRTVKVSVPKCCEGSYGTVSTGCVGECDYKSESKSSLCKQWNGICRDYTCDKSGFTTQPKYVVINENNNNRTLLWSVKATSFVRNPIDGDAHESKNVPATKCTVDNDIAEVSGMDIYRKACINPTCGLCGDSDVGCLNHKTNYRIGVSCSAPGHSDIGIVETSFPMVVEKAKDLEFNVSDSLLNEPIVIDRDLMVGDVILSIPGAIVLPDIEPDAPIYIVGPVSNQTGQPMFKWDDETEQVYVASDISGEPSGSHTVAICVELRRSTSCFNFTVTFVRTTTTSTTTPIPTDGVYPCQIADLWAKLYPSYLIDAHSRWCFDACKTTGPNCIYHPTFCDCSNSTFVAKKCVSLDDFANPFMDDWCTLNCNYGDYSHCPTEYCSYGFM